jgi:membrane-associated phospholipid phosphatase
LHLAFAGFSGLILARVHPGYGLAILVFIPLLAWSRLALLRHTFSEVIGGFALGLIAASIMLWL